jgi:hypothetical protein
MKSYRKPDRVIKSFALLFDELDTYNKEVSTYYVVLLLSKLRVTRLIP